MPAPGAAQLRDSHKVLLWSAVNAPRKFGSNFRDASREQSKLRLHLVGCVYRKLKHAHSDDEARRGSYMT
jgi:hypothetical protein